MTSQTAERRHRTPKQTVREHVLAQRDALPESQRSADSHRISERLLALPEFSAARTVLAYSSIGSEMQTAPLLAQLLRNGRQVVLPRINRTTKQLDLYVVRSLQHDLRPGVWSILEPIPEQCELLTSTRSIDAVLVPGVAFTPTFARLGYGGGFYDKLFAAWEGARCYVAAAYDLQIVDSVPVEEHDITMDHVITPTRSFARGS